MSPPCADQVGGVLLRRELVLGQLPGDELGVNVFVEREPPLLDLLQDGHRGDGLADRAGLEERPLRHGLARPRVFEAVTARPLHLEVFDDGDAHARRLVVAQALLDRPGGPPLTRPGGSRPRRPAHGGLARSVCAAGRADGRQGECERRGMSKWPGAYRKPLQSCVGSSGVRLGGSLQRPASAQGWRRGGRQLCAKAYPSLPSRLRSGRGRLPSRRPASSSSVAPALLVSEVEAGGLYSRGPHHSLAKSAGSVLHLPTPLVVNAPSPTRSVLTNRRP